MAINVTITERSDDPVAVTISEGVGPRGLTGETGAAGAQGPQGIQGETGAAGSDASVTNANVVAAIEAGPDDVWDALGGKPVGPFADFIAAQVEGPYTFVELNAIPEPSSFACWAIFVLASAFAACSRRNRRRSMGA